MFLGGRGGDSMMAVVTRVIAVLKLYFIGAKLLVYQLIHRAFVRPALPKQHGKVAIVTGGSRGIGFEIVKQLLELGINVIIASHNEEQGLAAVNRFCKEKRGAQVEFDYLDLSSLSSVQEFAKRFKERKLPLHMLINNAGVMLVPEGKTEDGYEHHFAINYLGHFLLTRLLLDIMVLSGKKEECSRVVNISSSAHYVSDSNLQDFPSLRNYSRHGSYARSKLAQLLFTYHLHKELQQTGCAVTSNAVDPGIVDTELYCNLSFPEKLAQKLIARLLFRSPAQAAETAVYAATCPDLESVSGRYLHDGNPVKSSLVSYNAELQSELWISTCRLLQLPNSIKT